MRIAVVNRWGRRIGGTESYLDHLLPALAGAGYEVGFWCEAAGIPGRDRLALPDAYWCAADRGTAAAIDGLQRWRPDLLYVHGLEDPAVEARLQSVAPGVFFAHDYYGTCISGHKATSLPIVEPCSREFGPNCLLQYFPRRCGGLNPQTMWHYYQTQSRRLELLAGYRFLLTHSTHLRDEYCRHGLAAEKITYYAEAGHPRVDRPRLNAPPATWRLLFLGRFDRLKGGKVLLDALPGIAKAVGRPVHLTFAGDGPYRTSWERRATSIRRRCRDVTVEFTGWVGTEVRDALLAASHLLVVPSQWPEPFGRIGPEAGSVGLPVVAFDVGGVRDWLVDGENGVLAPGGKPNTAGLAAAVIRALSDLPAYNRMSARGPAIASRFTMTNHLAELGDVFERAVGTKKVSGTFSAAEKVPDTFFVPLRILVATHHLGVVGGVETYLKAVLPRLTAAGHTVGVLAETADEVHGILPAETPLPVWLTSRQSRSELIRSLNDWRPDVVYAHGLDDTETEAALADRYPSVLFGHNYYGTCISGTKCHAAAGYETCRRTLGPGCLVQYFPRECGGRNPVTMLRMYNFQQRRRANLAKYAAVLVASRHMAAEYCRHGVQDDRLRLVPLFPTDATPDPAPPRPRPRTDRVLFVGRITDLKGLTHLIAALPPVAAELSRQLTLVVAGDGPARADAEAAARRAGVAAEFLGWVGPEQRAAAMRAADLLAVPSLWPEPFGLVGIEAGCVGLPAVGYAVGGIPDWLIPGVSGELAAGERPDPTALAAAMVRALADDEHWQRLRVGARETALRFSADAHLAQLVPILEAASRRATAVTGAPEVERVCGTP